MKLIILYILLTPASPRALAVGAFPTRDYCEAAKVGFQQLYADFHNARFVCAHQPVSEMAPSSSPRPKARP